MKRKIHNKNGFTLIEMLACILTIVLLSGICSTGINVALKCYQQSVFESESQMLKSTLDLSINDILRYATDVKTETASEGITEVKVTGFTNVAYQIAGGMIAVPVSGDNTNKFVVYNLPSDHPGRKEYLLVGNQVYGKYLYIEDFKLEYNTATNCFNGTYTIKSTVVEDVEKICTFTCRTISE